MEAKEFLGQAREAELGVEALLERRERCRAMAARRGPGCPEELAALEKALDERIREFAARTREVEAAIDGLESPRQRELLRLRYLNGWSWKAIGARMDCKRSWMFQLHERALACVGERLKGEASGD